jgi:hypothetical protein
VGWLPLKVFATIILDPFQYLANVPSHKISSAKQFGSAIIKIPLFRFRVGQIGADSNRRPLGPIAGGPCGWLKAERGVRVNVALP